MNAWKFIKQHRNNIVCYGSLTLVFVLFAILTKGKIYSAYNLKSLVGQMVVLMIISIGMIFLGGHILFIKFLQSFHAYGHIERLKHRGKSATITFELCEDPWIFYCQKGVETRKK